MCLQWTETEKNIYFPKQKPQQIKIYVYIHHDEQSIVNFIYFWLNYLQLAQRQTSWLIKKKMRSWRSFISSFFSRLLIEPSLIRRAWCARTRCVSEQKSRSRISRSLTGIIANASRSSRSAAVPTWTNTWEKCLLKISIAALKQIKEKYSFLQGYWKGSAINYTITIIKIIQNIIHLEHCRFWVFFPITNFVDVCSCSMNPCLSLQMFESNKRVSWNTLIWKSWLSRVQFKHSRVIVSFRCSYKFKNLPPFPI